MQTTTHGTNGASKGTNRVATAFHGPATDKPAPKKKAAKKRKAKAKAPPTRLLVGMTVALGVGIPLLSLALSKIGGTLAGAGFYGMAAFAFLLMAAVLGVSLSHLAAAIGSVTRSPLWASWALAVTLDLTLVLCELIHVSGHGLGLELVCGCAMVAVAIASMGLNVFAFLCHD
jgi:hypothetical protein